jgi:hypothetical protein
MKGPPASLKTEDPWESRELRREPRLLTMLSSRMVRTRVGPEAEDRRGSDCASAFYPASCQWSPTYGHAHSALADVRR